MLIHWYRFNNWLYRHKVPFLPWIIWKFQYLLFNSSVPGSCILGKGTQFGYGGIGVVVHARAVVGKNCAIGANVTIGGKSRWYEVPVIGDNVHIHTGAKVLGPIRIGNNVTIGANAVVVKDVPDNCVVAGVPARIIRTNVDPAEMYGKELRYRGDNPWPMTPMAENIR